MKKAKIKIFQELWVLWQFLRCYTENLNKHKWVTITNLEAVQLTGIGASWCHCCHWFDNSSPRMHDFIRVLLLVQFLAQLGPVLPQVQDLVQYKLASGKPKANIDILIKFQTKIAGGKFKIVRLSVAMHNSWNFKLQTSSKSSQININKKWSQQKT